MCALYHPDPDGGGEESVGTLPRVSGVKALLHAAAERQRAPGNVTRVKLGHVSRLTCPVLQTLKQLQREQHEARVAALVARNRVFYRRQRCCESFTAFVIIVSFSSTLSLHLQPNLQLTTTIQSSPCTWSYPTVSTTSGHRSITLSTSPPARTRKLERKYH